MRQLHVVALSEDGRFLLLGTGKETADAAKGKPAFKVPLDARLAAAVRGDLPRPGQTAAPGSDLTPKQIQARLRAGETVEQIARSAGVPAARVERFAGPVEGEKARVIAAAQAAVLTRARRGASAVSLGEAVTAHLVEVDVDPAEVVWSARRDDDGSWLVDAAYVSRGRRKRSTWRYAPGSDELTAADASSAVLGYVEPPDGRPATRTVAASADRPARRRAPRSRAAAAPRSAAAPRVPAAAKAPARGTAAKAPARGTAARAPARKTAATDAARKTATAAPAAKATATKAATVAPAVKASARKAATVAPAAKASARKAATVAPAAKASARKAATVAPAAKASARKAATVAPAAKATAKKAAPAAKASAKKAATAVTRTKTAAPPAAGRGGRVTARATAAGPAPSGPPQLRVVPPPDEEPKRASVPSWADVLLSTTPPSRPADAERD